MPRPPPRPLRLPDLLTNPQARAEYIESHPPIHSPQASSSRSNSSAYFNAPPSPSSTTDANSHRASAATFASSGSPATSASTHTSISVHNAPWLNDLGSRLSASAGGPIPAPRDAEEGKALPGPNTGNSKARASWSTAFASTKARWFGGSATEAKETTLTVGKKSSGKEIKLSPSMIAAYAEKPRPLSSPFPPTAEPPPLSPTGSTSSSFRAPRVGSGLRYYTERNPAPPKARVQIRDPIDLQARDSSRPTLPPTDHPPDDPLPALAGLSKQLHMDTTLRRSQAEAAGQHGEGGMSRGETREPQSPPPTHPMHVRDSDVPDIRVSSGDDL